MRFAKHMKPRRWFEALTQVESGAKRPWRWLPLSLRFRAQRGNAAPPGTASEAKQVFAGNTIVSRIERHTHHHRSDRTEMTQTFPSIRTMYLATHSFLSRNSIHQSVSIEVKQHSQASLQLGKAKSGQAMHSFINFNSVQPVAEQFRSQAMRTQSTIGLDQRRVDSRFLEHRYMEFARLTERPAITHNFATEQGQHWPLGKPKQSRLRTIAVVEKRLRVRRFDAPDSGNLEDQLRLQGPQAIEQVLRKNKPAKESGYAPAASSRDAAKTITGETAARPIESPGPSTATAPVVRIEGPALEKLAEDVMNRIERRVRIERERRGM